MANTMKKINYNDIVVDLLNALADRERDVVVKRHALMGNGKATLEQIGQSYNITRERVRQIENEGLKKVRSVGGEKQHPQLSELEELVAHFMTQHGGFIAHNHLTDHLLHTEEEEQIKALSFLLDNIIADDYDRLKHPTIDLVWRSDKVKPEQIIELTETIANIIENEGSPMTFEEIMGNCTECAVYPTIESMPAENHYIIEAVLRARKDLRKNILDQWGKDSWTTIKPKRMTDKAYLIMLREERPLHFEECAELINKANFDKKKACAATVHNELILDDKYVLVGRGIYALKDWGFEEGTVSDIIERILSENGPMDKKALTDEVLKQRMVQKTTITLALMNKDRFKRTGTGSYATAQ